MDVEGITTAKALPRERRIQGDFHYALLVICSCIVLLTSIVIADRLFGIDYYDLVRDPNAIAGQPKYFGLVSNLGVILWFTGGIAAPGLLVRSRLRRAASATHASRRRALFRVDGHRRSPDAS